MALHIILRRVGLFLWVLAAGLLAALIYDPVETMKLRAALVGLAAFVWFGFMVITWRRRFVRGGAKFLFETPSINALDHAALRPGDMAVTQSGVHILGYLCDRTWIEADPAAQKVLIAAAPSETVLWFKGPMKMVRWEMLE